MHLIRENFLVLVCVSAMLMLGACVKSKLKSPEQLADAQTLLVLPVHETNEAQMKDHGFYYIYEIVNIDSFDITHRAVFKLPIKENMLMVDSLPPGNYSVRQFVFKTMGSGDFSYGENVEERDDRFSLEEGEITIFHQSLNVRLYNPTPGHGMTTHYQFGMDPLTQTQREAIIGTLGALQYLNHWDISDAEIPPPAPPKKADEPATQPNQMAIVFDVTGTYMSENTGKRGKYLADMSGEEVSIIQTGDQISGNFGRGGKIWGKIEGNTIKFDFFTPGGATGTGEWKVNIAGSELRGHWLHTSRNFEGTWNLYNIDQPTSVSSSSQPVSAFRSHAQPAVDLDVTGTYASSITGNPDNLDIKGRTPEVKLFQNGNKISGSFGGANGKIWGDIDGRTIKFEWFSANGHNGRGTWVFKPGSNEVDGKWDHGHSVGSEGKWDLKRIE